MGEGEYDLGEGVGLVTKTLATPWTVAHHAPLSMGFSRQVCWSGLPFPPPGDLPSGGMEPVSPVSPSLIARLFTTEPPGNSIVVAVLTFNSACLILNIL